LYICHGRKAAVRNMKKQTNKEQPRRQIDSADMVSILNIGGFQATLVFMATRLRMLQPREQHRTSAMIVALGMGHGDGDGEFPAGTTNSPRARGDNTLLYPTKKVPPSIERRENTF
jgi:hypothetical protein